MQFNRQTFILMIQSNILGTILHSNTYSWAKCILSFRVALRATVAKPRHGGQVISFHDYCLQPATDVVFCFLECFPMLLMATWMRVSICCPA